MDSGVCSRAEFGRFQSGFGMFSMYIEVLNGILICSVFQKLGVPLIKVLIMRIIFYSSYERGL